MDDCPADILNAGADFGVDGTESRWSIPEGVDPRELARALFQHRVASRVSKRMGQLGLNSDAVAETTAASSATQLAQKLKGTLCVKLW